MSADGREKTHVVTTVYFAGRKTISHAYGPYTVSKARRVRDEIREKHWQQVNAGHLLVSSCRIIDVDTLSVNQVDGDNGIGPDPRTAPGLPR